MVVEADESDGSFVRLPATIAVVTNMDPEHLDHWGSVEAMIAGYDQFVSNVPFYGFAVLCIDHPDVAEMLHRLSDRILAGKGGLNSKRHNGGKRHKANQRHGALPMNNLSADTPTAIANDSQ